MFAQEFEREMAIKQNDLQLPLQACLFGKFLQVHSDDLGFIRFMSWTESFKEKIAVCCEESLT